ncbi:Cyclohexadienyl dehydrogenase [bioreactor metagenome]|uniref:Cyclohexadienyl dehydrogenase n=1 Tax=bioreactor metagenome TaxID=1076179 RepID=A0A644URR4_9ZZZZ|nr:prephenate dehydrogenase/arogenate dehydrogenase family protein [Negativicutes bacterium]
MSKLNITIIGLGLIGGSIGLSLKEGLQSQAILTGWDNNRGVREMSLQRKAVDRVSSSLSDAVKAADIVFLCTPILQMMPIVECIAPVMKQGAILTDVGSTKRFISDKIAQMLPVGIEYVGGHPMAGSEQSGIVAADKDLFRNKSYILVDCLKTSPAAMFTIHSLITITGALITTMDMEKHDLYAALASHVPHVTAAALVNLLDHVGEPEGLQLAGGGFRDTTRIAGSDADMWADICLSNCDAVADGLKKLQELLGEVIFAAQSSDREALYSFFSKAKQRRASITSSLVPN